MAGMAAGVPVPCKYSCVAQGHDGMVPAYWGSGLMARLLLALLAAPAPRRPRSVADYTKP